jgi:hypothetical protein
MRWLALFLVACSGSVACGGHPMLLDEPDAQIHAIILPDSSAPDVATDAPVDAIQPDAPVADAGGDSSQDSGVDSGPQDSGIDAWKGGDTCPILTYNKFPSTCPGFRVIDPNSMVDYPCFQQTPNCPTGWVCWALDQNNVLKKSICP